MWLASGRQNHAEDGWTCARIMGVPPPPVVGFVLAVRGGERFVGAALASLQAQPHLRWSCVVVDDGSRDGTAEIVARVATRDDRVRLVRRGPDCGCRGPAAARQTGLAELDGRAELVSFLDHDDLLLPDGLALLVQALRDRPDATGAYGLAELIDADGRVMHPGRHPDEQRARRAVLGRRTVPVPATADATFADLAVWGAIWPSAVALLRRGALAAAGGQTPRWPCAPTGTSICG